MLIKKSGIQLLVSLLLRRKPENSVDKFAIAVVLVPNEIVGHLLFNLSPAVSVIKKGL